MSYKKVESFCWFNLDGKNVLIITKGWKGSPIIACPVDMLLIPKSIKNKYKDCILPIALKDCKVVYTGE